MRKYQFVVGVSLPVLEDEVDRLVQDEPGLKLIQVLYAAGSGFVAVVEHPGPAGEPHPEPKGVAAPISPKKPGQRAVAPGKSAGSPKNKRG